MKTLFHILLTFTLFITTPNLQAASVPLSLTATDGTGLELRKLEARVVLDGFLAFTELELVFYNPEPRRREGHFQIVLPDNAAISRFAMKIGEVLQEGEVVEKQQARRAYEDFLHRRQDPALLETDSGNRFNARIFPIEPQSEKLLLLSYSQRLTSDYVLPLKGLPQLKQLLIKVFYDNDQFNNRQPTQLGALSATIAKRDVLSVDKRDYQPTEAFKMPYQPSQTDRLAMRSGSLVAAKIIPFPDTATTTTSQVVPLSLSTLVVLLDSSASQAPFWSETVKTLATLLPLLKVETFMVYTFDQTLTKVDTATSATAHSALLQKLTEYPILGASRLDSLVTPLKDVPLKSARVLLISDLVITAGETSATVLAQQFKTIPWLDRLDVLLPSYHNNRSLANKLVTAGKTTGMVAALPLSDVQLAQKLTSPVYADLPVTVTEALWSWPATVESLQTNEPLIVFAEFSPQMATSSSPPKETQTVNIQVANKTFSITPQTVHPLLLKREWIRARIDRLLDLEDTTTDKDLKSAYHHEVINLSVKDRVLSPYTSLLVLETEDDYRRFNIDRQALSDILTVGIDGLSVLKRAGLETPPPPPPVIEDRQIPLSAAKTRPRPSNGDSTTTSTSPPATPSPSKNKPAATTESTVVASDKEKGKESDDAKEPSKMEESVEAESKKADLDGGPATAQQEGFHEEEPVPLMKQQGPEALPSPAPPPPAESSSREESSSSVPAQADAVAGDASQLRHESTAESIRESSTWYPPASVPMGISESVPSTAAESLPREANAVEDDQTTQPSSLFPWIGRYAKFRVLLDKGDLTAAGNLVQSWRQSDLADLMALIALGEWSEKKGDTMQAARAYGSLIDYFPARADVRRWAGERLLVLKTETWLTIDTFKKAVEQRPDHPSGHYLLAIAYLEDKQYKEAVATLQTALQREFDPRFLQIKRILQETLALILTNLEKRGQLDILGTLQPSAWEKVTQPQWRFVMMWETDANDVDFHINDHKQNHAFFSQPSLPTGGNLYADITTGYGPECFTIPNPKASPYRIWANYYSMGPMGYGMGLVHVLRYFPTQRIQSEFRPFVVMQHGAMVNLGEVK